MPKAIKKKQPKKSSRQQQNDLETVLATTRTLGEQIKAYLPAIVVVLVILVSVPAWWFYTQSREQKAAELFAEGYAIYYQLGSQEEIAMLPGTQRFKKAYELFEQSYSVDESPKALYYMANSLYEQNLYGEAEELFTNLKAEFSSNEKFKTLSTLKLAHLAEKTNQTEKALGYLKEIQNSRLESFRDLAFYEQAVLLESMGRHEEALETYRFLAKKYPNSPYTLEARSRVPELSFANTPSTLGEPSEEAVNEATQEVLGIAPPEPPAE